MCKVSVCLDCQGPVYVKCLWFSMCKVSHFVLG